MAKEITVKGSSAIPISLAVRAGDLIFLSGHVAENTDTGAPTGGDTAEQTRQVLINLASTLESAGGSLTDVVKVTAYLTNIDDFGMFNDVYREFFAVEPPARATIEVSRLAGPFSVEIEAVATLPKAKPAQSDRIAGGGR